MGYRKSATCKGKISQQAVTEYDTEYDAQCGAEHAAQCHGEAFTPYRCQTCGHWHISPLRRQTPSRPCPYCTDSHGYPKKAYSTLKGAETRAAIIQRDRGLDLRPYECEYGMGWHLTKSFGW